MDDDGGGDDGGGEYHGRVDDDVDSAMRVPRTGGGVERERMSVILGGEGASVVILGGGVEAVQFEDGFYIRF